MGIKTFFGGIANWFKSLFWKQEMEITLVGLNSAGKTTLINVIGKGDCDEDMIPTSGFNMMKVTKGKVSIKLWDVGGQPRLRCMWERYCRGTTVIVFVVDSADAGSFHVAKEELHTLLEKPSLEGIPLLVLGNKNDLTNAVDIETLIEQLELQSIEGREVCCYSVSALEKKNIDLTLDWLIKHSKTA
eukprot:TRINITY_DN34523_c0_g1_i1.p1 TRINITY_DN34523_c0_g1~~TRINITY_DN34523_c0_g1_i1.p1  ORF type:complete len:187 (-),score=40.75 TRINITY_DN34523_c0_g1_i1:42-602(-)